MPQPTNRSEKYTALFTAIDKGNVKIPQFQREFVWSKEQSAKLIDSIIKGYPMGTFILWKTKERLRHIRNVGNMQLPDTEKGEYIQYVLDGQQRMTSLYAVRSGSIITRDNQEVNYGDICINLDEEPDAENEIVFAQQQEGHTCISVHKLLTASMAELFKNYPNHIEQFSEYKQRLEGYDFSTVVIDDYPIDVACEIFTRINTGGRELTLFEIMVAKTYDNERKFDLAEKYQNLISNDSGSDLTAAGFEGIPPVTVLQCIACFLTPEIKRQNILKLERNEFIDQWDSTISALFSAIDYLRTHCGVMVSRILPYNSILIPLTWFFDKINNRGVTSREDTYLKQFVYFAALTQRYGSAIESKVSQDIKRMDAISKGDIPKYDVNELPKITAEDLQNEWFSVGNARSKMIMCLLSAAGPKCFSSNGAVILNNSWLKVSSSKNYHHFFPKSFLKKQGLTEEWKANSVMNIVLVADYLNKRQIGAKAPSDYIEKFIAENTELTATLQTHFIGDITDFGITSDNYEQFLEKRSELIANQISNIINPRSLETT